MERSPHRLVLAVLVSLCMIPAASSAQAAARPAPAAAFLLGPGIVVDAAGAEIYLMRPEGGLEAVDTDLGRTLWTTGDAARPLAVQDGLLLAQSESTGHSSEIGLVLLDRRRGDTVRALSVDLPAAAWTGIDDGLGATFSIEAWGQSQDLLISWTSGEQRLGGALLERPAPRRLEGLARLAPQSGQLRILAPGEVSPPPPPQLLAPPDKQNPAEPGRQFLSVDGRHLLISERLDDDRVWEKYRWTLVERDSGERLGQVRSRWSMTELFVVGTNLVYRTPAYQRWNEGRELEEAPASVRAVDLLSGTELWRRAIRDTKYRGPFPP